MTTRPAAQQRPTDEEDYRSIREIIAEMDHALAGLDAARFTARFTADASFTTPTGHRLTGWDAIKTYHQRTMSAAPTGCHSRYTVDGMNFPAPDVAVVCVRQQITLAEGAIRSVGTWVFVEKERAWWIQAVHITGDPAGDDDSAGSR
jgi:uncharacterized protein (TIGR02246 family)